MIINVKAKHIKNGKPSNPNKCAVALALKDMGYKHIHVSQDYLEVWKGEYQSFNASKKLESFIDRFDHKRPVKPTSFKLTK